MNARFASMTTYRGGRIGGATVPRQRIPVTDDSLWLQRLMLDKPRSKDWPVGIALCVMAVFLTLLKMFGGWPS